MSDMVFYKLDLETSKKVYEKLKKLIEPKFCYNNVFYVMSHFISKFRDKNGKSHMGMSNQSAAFIAGTALF